PQEEHVEEDVHEGELRRVDEGGGEEPPDLAVHHFLHVEYEPARDKVAVRDRDDLEEENDEVDADQPAANEPLGHHRVEDAGAFIAVVIAILNAHRRLNPRVPLVLHSFLSYRPTGSQMVGVTRRSPRL